MRCRDFGRVASFFVPQEKSSPFKTSCTVFEPRNTSQWNPLAFFDIMRINFLRFLLTGTASIAVTATSSSSSNKSIVVRIRLPDGSIERLAVPGDRLDTLTLQDALAPLHQSTKETSILHKKNPADASRTLRDLEIEHGSLLTLLSNNADQLPQSKAGLQKRAPPSIPREKRYDPFPDLAKDYESAKRASARRRNAGSGLSYGDLAHLQSSLHVVEPQPEGPLKRVYMCRYAAERFQSNCVGGKAQEFQNRVGLLLGTTQRERVNTKPKTRTSLSSPLTDSDYCEVAKVHAIWEPPQNSQPGTAYDGKALRKIPSNVLRIAAHLGLKPVGWIFTYSDDRHKDQDALPVWSKDVQHGAQLQAFNMQRTDRAEGARFATLAMDAKVGTTEAFQLSDVAVQIVAEDMLLIQNGKKDVDGGGRYVTTSHAILVDGQETTTLDCVLCLVNTALLSHEGSFSGGSAVAAVKKKDGGLTSKTRKAILAYIDGSDDAALLEILSNFAVLLALDEPLGEADSSRLCETVRKWARGQRQGTRIHDGTKQRLHAILNH
jgi:hypothetical protein